MRRDPWVTLGMALLASALFLPPAVSLANGATMEAFSINPPLIPRNTLPAFARLVIRGIGLTPATMVRFEKPPYPVTCFDSRALQV